MVRSREAAVRPERNELGIPRADYRRLPVGALQLYRGNPHAAPYVSHTQRETTSIVRFIERNWALGTLGERDLGGDDLSDMFDYARPQPVPSFTYLAFEKLIHRTQWNLARSLRDTHVVDDDR